MTIQSVIVVNAATGPMLQEAIRGAIVEAIDDGFAVLDVRLTATTIEGPDSVSDWYTAILLLGVA